jgi:poly(beta-D-mannuronate) lyase
MKLVWTACYTRAVRRRTRRQPVIGLTFLAFAIVSSATAAENRVSTAADIARSAREAKPGETHVMPDGTWTNQAIFFAARGTAEQPVTLRAETAGKLVPAGISSVTIEGERIVVSGSFWTVRPAPETARARRDKITD